MTVSPADDDVVPLPTLDDIETARQVLRGVSVYTPMEESRWLSALAGGPVLIKAENLQRTGSFKIRGAYTKLSNLSSEELAAGVVAASAGNHGQAVAWAARELGAHAHVFMPFYSPMAKLDATRSYGAEVEQGDAEDPSVQAAPDGPNDTAPSEPKVDRPAQS